MSQVLWFIVLALCAAVMVSKISTEIRDTYERRRSFAAAQRVATRIAIDRWRRTAALPSDVLDEPDAVGATLDALLALGRRLRSGLRHAFCPLIHGHHELYRARTDTKLFQQCLLCGYETHGWTIDRRDRRLHLVSNKTNMRKAS